MKVDVKVDVKHHQAWIEVSTHENGQMGAFCFGWGGPGETAGAPPRLGAATNHDPLVVLTNGLGPK
jgi:hypothetical protein